MKIIKESIYTVEMSREELEGLYKVIGCTSTRWRKEEANLLDAEEDAVENLYYTLDTVFNS